MTQNGRPIGRFHDLDNGPDYLRSMLPFEATMLSWRTGPDGMAYSFFAAPPTVMWLPPEDFDWSRVVPARIRAAADGRRWLEASTIVVSARLAGDAISPQSANMPVNIAIIIDERLAQLDGIDFSMVELIAIAQLTMHDPLEAAHAEPTARRISFDALVDAGVFAHVDAQADYDDRFAQHAWGADMQAGTFTVQTTPPSVFQPHFLGSASPAEGTWMWGWNNVNNFPPAVVALAEHVRDRGLEGQIEVLSSATVPLDEDIVTRMLIAAKSLTSTWTSRKLDTDANSSAYFLLGGVPLSAPTATRVVRSITEGISITDLHEARFALESYARLRGLGLHDDGSVITLTAPDGIVVVTIDAQGRIVNVSAQAGPGQSTPAQDDPAQSGPNAEQPPPRRGLFRKKS